jgi:hypothetical protein
MYRVLCARSIPRESLRKCTHAFWRSAAGIGNSSGDMSQYILYRLSVGASRSLLSTAAEPTSSSIDDSNSHTNPSGPSGGLFSRERKIGPSMVGLTASLHRTFGPRDNADALLTCGGADLAAHASFDPDYSRAQGWIRTHAVGPAVLSHVLISGLIGALVEAAFPQAIVLKQSMSQVRPLIVGVPVNAYIEVTKVVYTHQNGKPTTTEMGEGYERQHGFQVTVRTQVLRLRDDAVISEGEYFIWIPDYLNC